MDGHTVVFSTDGTVANRNNGWTGRWASLDGNRIRISWNTGGFTDTLTVSSDCRSMDGANNQGRRIHVTANNRPGK